MNEEVVVAKQKRKENFKEKSTNHDNDLCTLHIPFPIRYTGIPRHISASFFLEEHAQESEN